MSDQIQSYIETHAVYLEELWRRLVVIVKVFALIFILGFFLTTPAIRILLHWVSLPNVVIVTTSPFQLIDFAMSSGFLTASIAIIPLVVYHLYAFLRPGLSSPERRKFLLVLPLAFLLFLIGFSYGVATMYFAVTMVAKINVSLGVANYWDIATFASQMLLTAGLLGLLFLSPLILTALIQSGMFKVEWLASKRRHVIAGIVVFVALLPPTDGLSMILMALPLVVVFELTILWNRYFGRKVLLA